LYPCCCLCSPANHVSFSLGGARRGRGPGYDSDSSEEGTAHNDSSGRRKKVFQRRRKKMAKRVPVCNETSCDDTNSSDDSTFEVQFEEPTWWQHLPTLKCIGLACLSVDEKKRDVKNMSSSRPCHQEPPILSAGDLSAAKSSLVQLVCCERRSNQLRALAHCIGFSTDHNLYGHRGDLSPFFERLRLHILSNTLFKERLCMDPHERSSEQSRWWGLTRPDSTSVIVEDIRSKAYQLLTVGDPSVVIGLCNEAWQGKFLLVHKLTVTLFLCSMIPMYKVLTCRQVKYQLFYL
jgi:hypothetical protein